MHLYACIQARTLTLHTYAHNISTHAYKNTYTQISMYTHKHTRAHTLRRTHTYMHTNTLSLQFGLPTSQKTFLHLKKYKNTLPKT